MRIGVNGFGRMGRLALRAGWDHPDLAFVAINEHRGDTSTMATLLSFDSIHGRWPVACESTGDGISVDGRKLAVSCHTDPGEIPWREHGVELVLECTGKFRTVPSIQPHFLSGAHRVLVSAPVKGGPPNLVRGVNDHDVDFGEEPILSASSCTTNCLAPIVRVLHDTIGIERGLVTTIHDPTNTQVVIDALHHDARRARASQINLIPTSSNSAYAVTMVVPELQGRLDSVAVRVPVFNASLTDCVFQMAEDTSVAGVNDALRTASEQGRLAGILGYEERPLVSSDYATDPRSAIVDGPMTRVTDRRLVKVLAWYDNEWGYVNRLVELAAEVARARQV